MPRNQLPHVASLNIFPSCFNIVSRWTIEMLHQHTKRQIMSYSFNIGGRGFSKSDTVFKPFVNQSYFIIMKNQMWNLTKSMEAILFLLSSATVKHKYHTVD